MTKCIFLFSELSGYLVDSIRGIQNANLELKVIHWPINPQAPFSFELGSQYIEKDSFSGFNNLSSFVQSFNPDLIYLSGWMDKDYLKIVKSLKSGNCQVVIGIDNPWKGNLKQVLAAYFFKFKLKPFIHFAWVPGQSQARFARALGFPAQNIKTGFYSANTPFFSKIFQSAKSHIPRRLIFAGRYVPEKGIMELIEAFKEINQPDWELCCIGTGPLRERIQDHPKIKHIGFIQPKQMPEIMKEGGVFVLPSKYEPWGVVVHEFAAAGYPLLLSDQVGAAEMFLEDGKNGFSFSWKKNNLKETLKKMMALPKESLIEMGSHSHTLAQKISPETWAKTLSEIIDSSHVRN